MGIEHKRAKAMALGTTGAILFALRIVRTSKPRPGMDGAWPTSHDCRSRPDRL